ncbi:Peptidyl-prolyl cis-trans isomerase CWC27 like protein [Eufriesea mexicana]|uniref:Peptidyl-prolyl cis-trans isomerase CWC27 like protein n=1 Tax=Eufriesea mexicana TaxID=516756 RepID=A0A310S6E5_9HYME|nr:Peptidyl-prolyl cis-trans isomerase CWC27 like protein [Eufriesea mexicana]
MARERNKEPNKEMEAPRDESVLGEIKQERDEAFIFNETNTINEAAAKFILSKVTAGTSVEEKAPEMVMKESMRSTSAPCGCDEGGRVWRVWRMCGKEIMFTEDNRVSKSACEFVLKCVAEYEEQMVRIISKNERLNGRLEECEKRVDRSVCASSLSFAAVAAKGLDGPKSVRAASVKKSLPERTYAVIVKPRDKSVKMNSEKVKQKAMKNVSESVNVTGGTIYNMLKLEEVLVDENDRPLYLPRLIKTKILNNPFADIISRIIVQETFSHDNISLCNEKFCYRNFNLLSFDEEAEEVEEESAILDKKSSGKSISAHDHLSDPKLSS